MSVTWLKKGIDSHKLAQQEALLAEQRKAAKGKMWRFYLKEGEEARITFVDGELSPEGFLLPPRYYEHNLYLNGTWNNFFVCPEHSNPEAGEKCPICEQGDKPYLVALFTIIDHRVFKGKDGTVYTDVPKILAAKPQSFEMLNKIAIKRGGLAGCTFDVSRVGDKAAAIGSLFDFVEKNDIEFLRKKYVRKVKGDDGTEKVVPLFVPANYEEEISYRSADELRAMGFGSQVGVSTAHNAFDTSVPSAANVNYSDLL